jgi:hypothetical protein
MHRKSLHVQEPLVGVMSVLFLSLVEVKERQARVWKGGQCEVRRAQDACSSKHGARFSQIADLVYGLKAHHGCGNSSIALIACWIQVTLMPILVGQTLEKRTGPIEALMESAIVSIIAILMEGWV